MLKCLHLIREINCNKNLNRDNDSITVSSTLRIKYNHLKGDLIIFWGK